ncbi:MAG: prepilin peptidase [Candidatus Nanogingivalaceae bacterium]|nr:MAG: prepilin peptidase [Candidatus Nanogingivalaceae bacterium]QWB91671.1 MAG: prepilin peptidase [Candidatus Nanogingivalaceae bacterium]
MENFLLSLCFGALGTVFGSFAVAQVWRLRAKQLQDEKASGEKIDAVEWKKLRSLVSVSPKNDRSHCLNCGYQLKWYDLIPIISWLSLGGKCRKCRSKIGATEFLAEVSMFALFVIIFLVFSPLSGTGFSLFGLFRLLILFLAFIPLAIMFIYDAKWSLLPTKVIWIFNFLAFIYWITAFANTTNGFNLFSIFNIAISMALFPLVYFVLAKISKEEWVGGGDWILAIGLIFLLPNQPIFAMLLLFLSNFVGLIFALLQSILQFKKVKRGIRIPFGPAMILATLILLIFQQFLLIFTSFIM